MGIILLFVYNHPYIILATAGIMKLADTNRLQQWIKKKIVQPIAKYVAHILVERSYKGKAIFEVENGRSYDDDPVGHLRVCFPIKKQHLALGVIPEWNGVAVATLDKERKEITIKFHDDEEAINQGWTTIHRDEPFTGTMKTPSRRSTRISKASRMSST